MLWRLELGGQPFPSAFSASLMSPTTTTTAIKAKSSKKRKLPELESPHAASSSKKAKTKSQTLVDSDIVPSVEKKKKKSKKHHKDDVSNQEFVRVKASMTISLPPIFVQDPTEGIEEMLDSMILRYE